MSLKNWPSWLKGGIILVFLILLFILILIPFGNYYLTPDQLSPYWALIAFLPAEILINLLQNLGVPIPSINSSLNSFFEGVIISFIIYFIIGAIIGWIYGKTKSKKRIK